MGLLLISPFCHHTERRSTKPKAGRSGGGVGGFPERFFMYVKFT
jgi:hypothetical protein